MVRTPKKTDRFRVVDKNGKRYHIIEYTEFGIMESPEGDQSEVKGLKLYQSPDAEIVNDLYDDTFELLIYDNQMNLRSIKAIRDDPLQMTNP